MCEHLKEFKEKFENVANVNLELCYLVQGIVGDGVAKEHSPPTHQEPPHSGHQPSKVNLKFEHNLFHNIILMWSFDMSKLF